MRRIKLLVSVLAAGLLCLTMMGAATSWADGTPPTVSAYVDGTSLFITASDDVSGIAAVRINGLNLPNAADGTTEVGLAGYTTTKTLQIQAVDNAGNNSEIVTLTNPCYGQDLSLKLPEARESEASEEAAQSQAPETVETTSTAATTQADRSQNTVSGSDSAVKAEVAAPEESSEADTSSEQDTGDPLTPDGNLTLVDDTIEAEAETLEQTAQGKQFLTVTTKNGNYFYIIVDRDGTAENVYFLNQVDESDLLALIEDDTAEPTDTGKAEQAEEEKPVCICNTLCEAGKINTACVACMIDLEDCQGEAPEPELVEDESEPEAVEDMEDAEETSGASPLAILFLLVILAGGGAAAYVKLVRPNLSKNSVNLDDLEYDEAEPEEAHLPENQEEREVLDL